MRSRADWLGSEEMFSHKMARRSLICAGLLRASGEIFTG